MRPTLISSTAAWRLLPSISWTTLARRSTAYRAFAHIHIPPRTPSFPAARASRFSYTPLHHCPFLTGDSTILTIAFYEKQLQVKRAHPRVPQDDKTYAAMLNE